MPDKLRNSSGWGGSWLFVETRDGRKGSLRAMEYADPPVAFLSCPNNHYRVEMPDDADADGPLWHQGEKIKCPKCGADALVLHAFWHETFAFIEWYQGIGSADYVAFDHPDGGSNIRPVSWRPVRTTK